MIKLFFLVLIGYGLFRLIRFAILVQRTIVNAKQRQDQMNSNRSQKKPFNDVEEADYEVLDD
jgi:hypothetical protein